MSSQQPLPPLSDANVSDEEQNVEIPEWHRELLDERMARYRENGMKGRPWEEFEKELDKFLEELNNRRRVK